MIRRLVMNPFLRKNNIYIYIKIYRNANKTFVIWTFEHHDNEFASPTK